MSRALEIPDEIVLSDSTVVALPADLLARLDRPPDCSVEVLQRVADGDVERWLHRLGWHEIAQQCVRLHKLPANEALTKLKQLLKRTLVSPVLPRGLHEASRALPETGRMDASAWDVAYVERHRSAIRAFAQAEAGHKHALEDSASRRKQTHLSSQKRAQERAGLLKARMAECHLIMAEVEASLRDLLGRPAPLSDVEEVDSSLDLDQAHRISQEELHQFKALVEALRQAEETQVVLRMVGAVGSVVIATVLLAYGLGGSATLLAFPLLLGGAISVWRVDHAVSGVARLGTWLEAKHSSPRAWVKLLVGGFVFIWRATDRIQNRYYRSGARATTALYYAMPLIGLLLMIGYIVLLIAVFLAVLALMLWIIGKMLEG